MEEFLFFFLSVLVLFTILNKFKENKDITTIISKKDNRKYIVRKLPDAESAADKLAEINNKILILIKSLENKEHNDYTGNVKTLINRFNPDALSETGKDAEYTSYSVNKGQKISICIRNKDNSFINNNTVIFVVIHELAHVMTDSIGHTEEFWDNMKYLLEKAEEINIYTPQDYNTNPVNYCGMEINSTPYDFKK
tara:strand:+ start:693 stop:1277 length:585 start_codon:yes stop_codon:yes gene_type:complete